MVSLLIQLKRTSAELPIKLSLTNVSVAMSEYTASLLGNQFTGLLILLSPAVLSIWGRRPSRTTAGDKCEGPWAGLYLGSKERMGCARPR
jgi:hypothetical protein